MQSFNYSLLSMLGPSITYHPADVFHHLSVLVDFFEVFHFTQAPSIENIRLLIFVQSGVRFQVCDVLSCGSGFTCVQFMCQSLVPRPVSFDRIPDLYLFFGAVDRLTCSSRPCLGLHYHANAAIPTIGTQQSASTTKLAVSVAIATPCSPT